MKKVVMIAVSGIVLGLLGAGGYLYYVKTKTQNVTAVEKTILPTNIAIEYATWKDPLGVSFSYPKDAVIDNHDEDKENYMHVEITSATHSGGLVLWAKDFPKGITNLSLWAKKETATGSGIIVDTTVNDIDAKKIMVGDQRARIGVIYDGLLFEVDATFDEKGYWKEVFDTTLSSFTFYPLMGSAPSGDTGGSIDEEEVLE